MAPPPFRASCTRRGRWLNRRAVYAASSSAASRTSFGGLVPSEIRASFMTLAYRALPGLRGRCRHYGPQIFPVFNSQSRMLTQRTDPSINRKFAPPLWRGASRLKSLTWDMPAFVSFNPSPSRS